MTVLRPRRYSWNALTVAAALLGALAAPLGAHSVADVALGGEVVLTDGTPVTAVNLTLEDPSGIVIRQFRLRLLPNWLYDRLFTGARGSRAAC